MHEHLEAALDHVVLHENAEVIIVCSTAEQADCVFDELWTEARLRGLNANTRWRELITPRGQLQVMTSLVSRAGLLACSPTLAVDYYAPFRAFEALRHATSRRGGVLLVCD